MRRVKTMFLALLVLTSFVLSDLLWRGYWQGDTEMGLDTTLSIPLADKPTVSDVSIPFRIVFFRHGAGLSASYSSQADYAQWMERLKLVNLFKPKMVTNTDWTDTDYVSYQLGATLSRADLISHLPGAITMPSTVTANQVVFSQEQPDSDVVCYIVSDDKTYECTTDFGPELFHTWLTSSVLKQPAFAFHGSDNSILPIADFNVTQSEWMVRSDQPLPLIHSFFVNPDATTRIQARDGSTIWTDGSRAVEMDAHGQELTYQDPNIPNNLNTSVSPLFSATEFVREHGGTSSDCIAFSDSESFLNTSVYTFRTYVNGYPVLGMNSEYQVSIENGEIYRFTRPLWEFTSALSSEPVRVLGSTRLLRRLEQLQPNMKASTLDVELGYRVQNETADIVALQPVYMVSRQGLVLWTLDASSGRVLKGGS